MHGLGKVLCVPAFTLFAALTDDALRAYSKPPLAHPRSLGETSLRSLTKQYLFMQDLGRCPSQSSATTYLPICIRSRFSDTALSCLRLGLQKVGVRLLSLP